MRLYFWGQTPRSLRELDKLRKICDERFTDRYELEVVDFDSKSALFLDTPIFAPFIAMETLPIQIRYIVRILANEESVLIGVQLSHSRRPAQSTS